jgi:hypothetical protein
MDGRKTLLHGLHSVIKLSQIIDLLFLLWYGAIDGADNIYSLRVCLLIMFWGTGSPVANRLTSIREYNSTAKP